MNKFFIYPGNYSGIIRDGLLRRGNWIEEENKASAFTNCHFIWKPTNISVAGYNKLDGIVRNRSKAFIQVFNHFENIRGICTKTGIIRSLKKYYQRNKEAERADYTVFDSTPTSFIITAGVDDHEHAQFIARFREIERQNFSKEKLPQKHCTENMWLVKPANLNQGKGIKVFKSLKDIHSFLNEKEQHSFWVIQKYIEKPLLYFGRKFDIRVWVLVTHKNEIFVYKKAYIRTSSDSYDLNNKNNYVHLTNNCLQQFGDNYGKHEDGNTLPLETLDAMFEQYYPDKNVKLETHVLPRIKDLVTDTILCTKPELNPKHRPNIFEFFGYDFMIDEDLRTWLIEINTNPYLGTPNEYIGKLLPNMVDDLLELTADHLFQPKNSIRKDRPNDFELIYCEGNSKYHEGSLNLRSPFTANIYPVQEMAPADAAKRLAAAEKRQQLFQSKSLQATSVKFTSLEGQPNKNNLASSQVVKNQSVVATETEKANFASKEALEKKESEKELAEKELAICDSIEDSNDEAEIIRQYEVMAQPNNEDKLKWSKSHKSSIEVIYKNLHLSSIYKTTLNTTTLAKELNVVLSCLKNWELISEKRSDITCKTLKLIAQSSANFLLAELQPVNTLAELLKSSNVNIDIKLAIVETINFTGKEIALKKKLISTKLIHELVRICISSCDEKEIQNYSKQLLVTALKCLINLGAPFFRKAATLSDAKDYEKTRSSYMAQGALLAIWLVANHSIDPDMKEIAFRTFLINVDHKSMEKQLHLLELLKIIPEASENEDSDVEEANKVIQNSPEPKEKRQTVQDEIIEDNRQKETDLSTINYQRLLQTEGDFSPAKNGLTEKEAKGLSFPKSLLKIYSLERLQQEFREFLRCLRDVQYNKENEEKDRRILIENEKQRKDDQKRQLIMEEARRLHTPKTEKRSKSKLKLLQIQHMYQRYKIDSVGIRLSNQSPERITAQQFQVRKRESSIENNKKESNGKFVEDLMERMVGDSDGNFGGSKSQVIANDGSKKAGKAANFKEKARELKSYRIMSKTNTISAPSLRYKNSLAASLSSAPLGQSRDLNSDTENTNQITQNNPMGFRTHYASKVKLSSDKKLRASVEEDEAKQVEGEQLFAHELSEALNRKNSQKQLKVLPLNQVDNETKEHFDTTSRAMRKSNQSTKRKNHTPSLPKRTVL